MQAKLCGEMPVVFPLVKSGGQMTRRLNGRWRAPICLAALALPFAVAGCGSGATNKAASADATTTHARAADQRHASSAKTGGTIQFLSAGAASSFCGLLPISAAAKLIPGFSGVPTPTLVSHEEPLQESSGHGGTAIACNYQDGNAQLASVWLRLVVYRPAIPLTQIQVTNPADSLTHKTIEHHPAAYEINTTAVGRVHLYVELPGTLLVVEPYPSSEDPLRIGEQGSGPAELAVAEKVAEAVISGAYAGPPPSTPSESAHIAGPYGLGATLHAWTAHHQPNSFSPNTSGAGGYNGFSGPIISGAASEWESVSVRGGRVDYFSMEFPKGTTQATAVSQVKAQLPSDSVVYVPRLGPSDSAGNNCEWFGAKSASLVRLLAGPPTNDTNGDVTVILQSPAPSQSPTTYDPSNVGLAIVTAEPVSSEDACNTGEPTN